MKIKIVHLILLALLPIINSGCGKKTAETTPIRKDVTETVFASGYLEANGTYTLTAKGEGYLYQMNFKEGDLIRKGEVLAKIDNKENRVNSTNAEELLAIAQSNTKPTAPSLLQAKNSILMAQQKLQLDSLQLSRYSRLLEKNSVSQISFDNIQLQYNSSLASYQSALERYKEIEITANQSLITNNTQKKIYAIIEDYSMIRALVPGKVYKRYRQNGDFVKKGETIAEIGDANFVYAKVNIDETNISKVKPGQQVTIQLNTNKEKIYKGVVGKIYPAYDEETQSFICELHFTDSLDFRLTGTQLQANIIVDQQKNALLIPRNYLDFSSRVQIKGQQEPVKITTKFISSDWVQVLGGIDEHTKIVTENIPDNKLNTSEVGAQMH